MLIFIHSPFCFFSLFLVKKSLFCHPNFLQGIIDRFNLHNQCFHDLNKLESTVLSNKFEPFLSKLFFWEEVMLRFSLYILIQNLIPPIVAHTSQRGLWFERTWIYTSFGCFHINLSFSGIKVLEKKIFKVFSICIYYFINFDSPILSPSYPRELGEGHSTVSPLYFSFYCSFSPLDHILFRLNIQKNACCMIECAMTLKQVHVKNNGLSRTQWKFSRYYINFLLLPFFAFIHVFKVHVPVLYRPDPT